METVTTIADVRTFETRGGNQRYVVRDADGNEYMTFREAIGESARELYETLKPFKDRVAEDIKTGEDDEE